LCCQLRKVIPLRRFLADKRAWMTGIRREQSPTRANTRLVEWNVANQVLKINPLAAWSETQIWDYIRAHELPFNPLHERGYPSLGCVPCTRAIAPGEDQRAGRWFGYDKLECGIHVENGQVRRVNVAHQR
jgi:phosphoadenosine phosphosulfate reductase